MNTGSLIYHPLVYADTMGERDVGSLVKIC